MQCQQVLLDATDKRTEQHCSVPVTYLHQEIVLVLTYAYRSLTPLKRYTSNQTQNEPHSHSKALMKHTYTWILSSCQLHWRLGHLRSCAHTHTLTHTQRSYSCQLHKAISNTHHAHIQHNTHTLSLSVSHTHSLSLAHTHTHMHTHTHTRTHTHAHTHAHTQHTSLNPHGFSLLIIRCLTVVAVVTLAAFLSLLLLLAAKHTNFSVQKCSQKEI